MPYREELRKEWVAKGYTRHMGSACVVPPPPNDQLRVYHFTSADHAISDIALRRIKISRFSEANDPFELLALTSKRRETRDLLRKYKSGLDEVTGLLCFSRNWTSPVLWSHYGARHQGICLGFNIPKKDALAVDYANDRIRQDSMAIDNSDQIDAAVQSLLMRTKFSHWKYEEEVRLSVPLSQAKQEGKNYFYNLGEKVVLAEVVLGPLFSGDVDTIRALVTSIYSDVVTFKARIAINTFSIVPSEKTIP